MNSRIKTKLDSSLIFRSGIASVDQAILSAVNFFVSIILIKNVGKLEYGYYSIFYPMLLFFIAIQNAIINTPLAILLITKKGKDKQLYAGSLCYGQFIVIIPIIFLALISVVLLWLYGMDSILSGIIAALCIAVAGILYREFLRSYFFAEEKPLKVLKLDIFYVMIFLSLIAFTLILFYIKTAFIFFYMGLSAAIVSLIVSRRQRWKYHLKSINKSYRENWKFGKWALLGVIVTHIQTYSYIYMLGALLGSVAVADVSAARILLMPLALFQIGWSKIIIPYGSKLREQNQMKRFFNKQILASLGITICIILYVILLFTFSNILFDVLLSEKYQSSFNYILYFGISFTLGFIKLNAANGLMVMKNFDILTKLNFLSMLITLICTYFFIQNYGIRGGLIALIIGEFILAIFLWFYFTKSIFSKSKNHIGSDVERNLLQKNG